MCNASDWRGQGALVGALARHSTAETLPNGDVRAGCVSRFFPNDRQYADLVRDARGVTARHRSLRLRRVPGNALGTYESSRVAQLRSEIWRVATVTITVPVYNAAASIRSTLGKLLELDYPRDRLQILVISDASTDATDEIVRSFHERGVELLRLPERRGKTQRKTPRSLPPAVRSSSMSTRPSRPREFAQAARARFRGSVGWSCFRARRQYERRRSRERSR